MIKPLLPKISHNLLWWLSAFCLTITTQSALLFPNMKAIAGSLNSAKNLSDVHLDYLSNGCRVGAIELTDMSDWLSTEAPLSANYTSTASGVYGNDVTIGTPGEEVSVLDLEEGQVIQVGYTTVFPGVSMGPSRRAEQVTIPVEGVIQSVSIYHNGGSGGLLLAVYSDNTGTPGTRLGVTPTATVNSTEGWQELDLIYPVSVLAGQKVWLAWLTETAVGLRYGYDSPGRIDSGSPWSGGMPMVFGPGTSTGAVYSLYATVIEGDVQNYPNLVAYWELDNSPVDVSGNNIHGELNGNPQYISSAVVGSHAIEFNGVDQYIDFGNPTQLPSGRSPRTMSAWLKTNDVSYDYRFAVAYGKAAVSSAMFIGQRGTELCGGGGADGLSVNDFWEIDTWHHVALTYDGDTARLYGDGIMLTSTYKNWSLILDKVYLGRNINNIAHWNGAVDDVRIYDKALSDAEVLDLYNQHASNYLAAPSNLVISQIANQKVELTWQDNSDNEEGFIVERSENGGVFSHLDSLDVNTISYQDSTVATGNYYHYRLFAFNTSLNSDSVVTDSLYITSYQQNLVAHWKLDNSPNDASGNNIHGIINGNPQFVQSAIVGSHAIELNGVDQYIDFGNPTQLPSGKNSRTMSAWLKTNDVSYNYRFAVAYGKAIVKSSMFIGQRGTELIGSSGADDLSVNNFWESDTWHHIVLTYDGDTAKLYGDGIMLSSSYKDWSLLLDKVYVGRNVNSNAYWNGAVDDVRIYDKALSDVEVLDLYNQHASNYLAAPSNLVISQITNQKVELTWQDNSGNEEGFIVERSENGGVFSHLDSLDVNTSSYQDSTVAIGNYYHYRLFAFNTSLNSDSVVTDSLYITSYQQNLVAHWKLDNNVNDASGNNIHGIINGNPEFVQSAIVGSHAIELNGVDQYIDFGNPTQLPSGKSPRTMSAWLKTNDVSYSYRFAVAYGKAIVKSSMFIGQRGTELIGSSGADDLSVNNFWEIDTWHHIVLSYDGDTARLYGDGIMLSSSYKDWSLLLEKVYVGRNVNSNAYWNGAVDDVRIYDKALNDAEILDLYSQHAGNYLAAPTNLVISQTASQNVELTWQDNSENEDGFLIERKITADSLFAILGDVPRDLTNYIDSTVVSNTSYDYRIQAYNAIDSSTYSNVTSVFVQTVTVLPPPTEFKLTRLINSKAEFSWSYNSSEELGFIIQRKDGIDGLFQTKDSISYRAYSDFSILRDTIYSYRVAAYGAFGLSDFSEVVTLQSDFHGMVLDSIEYKALESLFIALDGENWDNNYNWLSGSRSEDFANWYGLTVEEGDVVGIDLSYNNLTGEIPEEFCQLEGLRGDLRLEGNYLTGSYPANYGNLGLGGYTPPELFLTDNKLTHLREVQGFNHVLYNILYIEYNQIEFSSLEQYASQWHYVEYNPQNEIGEAGILEVISGSDVQIGSEIGGAYTSWQWQKLVNDVWQDITGETDSAIAITEINASHEGEYRCVATNTQFSSLTLYTATKTIKVTVDENYDQIPDTQELLALTAIFSKLGGEGWSDSTNWLNGTSSSDFASWYGITVENGDVKEVNLQSNNLQGEIPPEIQQLGSLRVLILNNNQLKGEIPVQMARLEDLEELYLDDNQLEGYMDLEFSVMPNIRVMALQNNHLVSIPDFSFNNSVDPLQVTLNAENNKLEFYYIENNLNTDGSDILGTFTYMPQKTYGEPRILGFIVGNELVLKVNMLGRANHYQWQFSPDQGQSWTDKGTDDPEYTETGIGESQEGWYRVRITNDRANEVGDEIVSAIYNVRIEKAPVVVNRPVD